MKFRTLKASEIDCRVARVNEKGVQLLLYKDARVDMNLLDATVGPENWTRKHELINGNLFCSVGIYLPGPGIWVYKQDVGVESYTEKEKGQASDSFKRACVNWGIGRELYSAPFIWIPAGKAAIKKGENGKYSCYSNFKVSEISYNPDREISGLIIVSEKGAEVWRMGSREKAPAEAEQKKDDSPAPRGKDERLAPGEVDFLRAKLEGVNPALVPWLCKAYKVESLEGLTIGNYAAIVKRFPEVVESFNKNAGA